MAEPRLSLVDSHCHIDMAEFNADREAVVVRARGAGVTNFLIVGGVDMEGGHLRAIRVAEEWGVPVSAGLHPHEARLFSDAFCDELRGLALERRIVAIGEAGLDFHYDYSPRAAQREAFRRQVRLAREVGLPVIVHTREADLETLEILEGEGSKEVGGVIHCFTGGVELARRALELGFYVSFSGIVTFPRTELIRDVARSVPMERLLVETDAPFLAPVPYRGRRNEPAFVLEVARFVAQLRGITLEEVGSAVSQNFARLFGRH
jgi:TatD DNase family protein